MKIAAMFLCVLSCPLALHAADTTIVVATDGSGQFKTVQEAIEAVPKDSADRTIIEIKPGRYDGHFRVTKDKKKVTFKGSDTKTTILTWPRNVYDPIPQGHDKFNPGLYVAGDDFTAENLTIENTSGDHGQALAMRIDSDRAIVRNCRLLGWQDTLMVNNGRQYFENCYIEGRVDFIYGSGTAVFVDCEIHSKNGGYVTAASTPQDEPFGFVFLKCHLTGDGTPWDAATTNPATTLPARKPGKMTELGRPWRPYASVAFIECELDDHIKPTGWNNWGKVDNEKTARYVEYNNIGPGADTKSRVPWSHQLTAEEAAKITPTEVLKGADNWNPAAH